MLEMLMITMPAYNKYTYTGFVLEMLTDGSRLSGSVSNVGASDFRSSHDLMVRETDPCVGLCADSMEPA